MIVPCIVNSWLYCSGDRNCMPGRASSARMSSAMKPPIRKNTKRRDHVHDPDLLRVRRPQQPRDCRALDGLVHRPRPGHDRLRCDGGHQWPPGASIGVPRAVSPQNSPFYRPLDRAGSDRRCRSIRGRRAAGSARERSSHPGRAAADHAAPGETSRVRSRSRVRSSTHSVRGRRRLSYRPRAPRRPSAARRQRLGQHDRVLQRHRRALGQRGRGGVRGVADQHDRPARPAADHDLVGERDLHLLHRVEHGGHRAAVAAEDLAQPGQRIAAAPAWPASSA